MTIASEITRLQTAKADIKSTVNGYLPNTIGSETLDEYDTKIGTALSSLYKLNTVTDGTVTKALDMPIRNLTMNGNSSQSGTPTPTDPQEITVMKGRNLVTADWASDFVTRINLTEHAKLETKDNRNCLWFYCQAGYGNYDNKYMYKTAWKENTQYTFSFDYYSAYTTPLLSIEYTDGSTTTFSDITTNTWVHITKTSIANKTIKYLRARYKEQSGYIDIDTFQVEQGSTATSYLPYNTIGITQSGKNLAKITECDLSGTNYTFKIEDNLVNINSTASANSFDLCGGLRTGTYLPSSYSDANDYTLTTANGGTYILSLSSLSGSITGDANTLINIYTNQRAIQSYLNKNLAHYGTKTLTLQSGEYIKSIYLWTNTRNDATDIAFKIQLEAGSTATSYEPYHTPKTYQLPLGDNYLAKVGDVSDTLSVSPSGVVTRTGNISHIASYAGETITTEYISTTGQLTTGAEIYYVATTPTTTTLTPTTPIELYEGTNIFTYTATLQPSGQSITYIQKVGS